MTILLLFAFISGLVTIFAPCIWPLLPIILSSSATGGKSKSLGITLGIMVSFGLLTLTISYIVKVIPFDPNALRLVAVVVIGFLGLTLIIPRLNQMVEGMVSRLSGLWSSQSIEQKKKSGFGSGFIIGLSLGIVWTPCAGPILATLATLAAT
jgi:cytochrome c biogenesis protein CcdA